jgi:hypothetical protein
MGELRARRPALGSEPSRDRQSRSSVETPMRRGCGRGSWTIRQQQRRVPARAQGHTHALSRRGAPAEFGLGYRSRCSCWLFHARGVPSVPTMRRHLRPFLTNTRSCRAGRSPRRSTALSVAIGGPSTPTRRSTRSCARLTSTTRNRYRAVQHPGVESLALTNAFAGRHIAMRLWLGVRPLRVRCRPAPMPPPGCRAPGGRPRSRPPAGLARSYAARLAAPAKGSETRPRRRSPPPP